MLEGLKDTEFPFLFGGTFIEGGCAGFTVAAGPDFPSFSEGLSLRVGFRFDRLATITRHFPSFSEGLSLREDCEPVEQIQGEHFPSFSEGLSLRVDDVVYVAGLARISLPFRRDFH